jgi:hypothetical protein
VARSDPCTYDFRRDPFEQTLRRSAGRGRRLGAGEAHLPGSSGRSWHCLRAVRDSGFGSSTAAERFLYRHPLPSGRYPKSIRSLRRTGARRQLGPALPSHRSVRSPGRSNLDRHQHHGHPVDRSRKPPALSSGKRPPEHVRDQLRQGPDPCKQWVLHAGSGRQDRRSLRPSVRHRSRHHRCERVLRNAPE